MIANRIRMKSFVGGGTFEPGDFTFNDILINETTNTVTFTKSGRLCISGIPEIGEIGSKCFINDVDKGFFVSQNTALLNPNTNYEFGDGIFVYNSPYGVFDIGIGDTMYFTSNNEGGAPVSDFASITFYLDTFDGIIITNFTITKDGI